MTRRSKPTTAKQGWALYLRTSDEEAQNPEQSQARQRFAIQKSFLDNSDMPVYAEYIDNLTGKSPLRKDYLRLLEDARAGLFSCVVVERADRFGRNDTEALRAIDELDRFGVGVRFANQPDLNPMDPDHRVVVALTFTLARRESMLLGLRVKGGLGAKMRSGGFVGRAPDGYINKEERTNPEEKMSNGKYKRWIEPDHERFKIWRNAWDMLLDGILTLEQIAENLHSRGHTLRSGRPFVTTNKYGMRKASTNALWHIFHNWFYAGWVVSETANILPKTVRGNWTPLVTTEEFEQGIAILAKRNEHRSVRRTREYLLRGLLYVVNPDSNCLVKMIGSTPNTSRKGGGTPYYSVPRSNINIMCGQIEKQILTILSTIQISEAHLPKIREEYKSHISQQYGKTSPNELQDMSQILKDIDDEEARMARLLATKKISEVVWDRLWNEWQDRRQTIQKTIQLLQQKKQVHIDNLDSALAIIAKISILYSKLEFCDKKELLQLIIERIIVNRTGEIIQVDLLPPFAYLMNVSSKISEDTKALLSQTNNVCTSEDCSTQIQLSDPGRDRTYDPLLKRQVFCR